MEKLTILGTGAAMVTRCYNTCFTISDESEEHILIDSGGGNGILNRLECANIKIGQIRAAFISHNHTDHILGIIWIIRYIGQEINKDRYKGNFTLYAHQKTLDTVRTICTLLIKPKTLASIDKRIIFHQISDGYKCEIVERQFTFFDIHSKKELQHGFITTLKNGKQLAFLGDEPMHEENFDTIRGSEIVVQEAYCRQADATIFNPFSKHHGTALSACWNATRIGAETTILVHTEGRSLDTRKELYTEEGQKTFSGKIYVPDDLEIIELD